MHQSRINALPIILFCGLLLIYSFGLNGIFFIDDEANLAGLMQVQDVASAWGFVTSGNAGPLGRPVALASFLFGAGSFPESAKIFLATNILIHLCNALLLVYVVRQLQRQLPNLFSQSKWFAVLTGFFWGVLPILASTSLMVVQRMTSLSALFVLLGVGFYLWAQQQKQVGRTLLAVSGIGLCTLLSALSKENGILLPLLLLVMHCTLFGQNTDANIASKRLLLTALLLPSLAVLGYMAYKAPGIASTYWNRPFTLNERLATEPVILWEYLRTAFLPTVMGGSPFRDDYPIYRFSDKASIAAIAGWLALLVAAVVLWLKRKPLLLFAVLWFLAGHLLESSMFALFLYFEHRNYVPIIGPVIALAAWFARLPLAEPAKRLLAVAYLGFLAFVLWQVVGMWGNRQHLVWAKAHPDSPRAMQMLAGAYMQAGRVNDVDALYEAAIQRNPRLTSVAVQGLRASCYMQDGGAATRKWLGYARSSLPEGDFSHLTITALDAVMRLQIQGQCASLVADEIVELATMTAGNPVFRGRSEQSHLHTIQANVYLANGASELAMQQMRDALQAVPDMETIRALHQLTLATQGEQAAKAFLQWASSLPPPVRGHSAEQQWHADLSAITAP